MHFNHVNHWIREYSKFNISVLYFNCCLGISVCTLNKNFVSCMRFGDAICMLRLLKKEFKVIKISKRLSILYRENIRKHLFFFSFKTHFPQQFGHFYSDLFRIQIHFLSIMLNVIESKRKFFLYDACLGSISL